MTEKKKKDVKRVYKAVVIGCGWIGCGAGEDVLRAKPASHAEAFRAHPQTTLVGIADINKKNLSLAGRLYPEVETFSDAEEMLKKLQPDIVAIATDPDSHCKMVSIAARCGAKLIISEKPLAHNLKEARHAVASTKKSHSILLVNHTRRFDPLIRKYRDYARNVYVKDTFLGKICSAVGYYDKGVFHGGTHIVDLFRFFLGEIRWVSAVENKLFPGVKGDINADALLGFDGAVAALQIFNSSDYALSEINFFGDRGKLTLRRMAGIEVEGIGVGSSHDFSAYRELNYAKPLFIEGAKRSLLAPLVEHAVLCLEKKDRPVSTGEDALKVLEAIMAIRKSVKLDGKKVNL